MSCQRNWKFFTKVAPLSLGRARPPSCAPLLPPRTVRLNYLLLLFTSAPSSPLLEMVCVVSIFLTFMIRTIFLFCLFFIHTSFTGTNICTYIFTCIYRMHKTNHCYFWKIRFINTNLVLTCTRLIVMKLFIYNVLVCIVQFLTCSDFIIERSAQILRIYTCT